MVLHPQVQLSLRPGRAFPKTAAISDQLSQNTAARHVTKPFGQGQVGLAITKVRHG